MPAIPTVKAGELRKAIADGKLGWQVADHLADTATVPTHGTGANLGALTPAQQAKAIDFNAHLAALPGNPFLARRAIARKFVAAPSAARAAGVPPVVPSPAAGALDPNAPAGGAAAPAGGTSAADDGGAGSPSSVNWKNRWGWPWITSVRDQGTCESCWAFSTTALTEAMVRIEHGYFPTYSEGDVHQGMGAKCLDTGHADDALDWINQHGLCDPQCFAWTTADVAYAPTADRSGRTVRGGLDKTDVGSVADQKTWLDTVGPLVSYFEVWHDFDGYGAGVYRRATASWNFVRGGHFMLVVGYNDEYNAWYCKNSWGTSWGVNGYVWVGYGEAKIDQYAKVGVRNTNPDPWTKRRSHSGGMIDGGNGAKFRNFELLATVGGGGTIQQWCRNNDVDDFPWQTVHAPFGGDAAACPTLISTTFNRNFECVYPTTTGRLHHWWFDQVSNTWNDGGVFGPSGVTGVPGFIQGNYGAPGNFEVVVRAKDGGLEHWWRQNAAPWAWAKSSHFGKDVAFSGPSLVQTHNGAQGNLELVCVLTGGQMQHWSRDNDQGGKWNALTTFGKACSSGPCMIEGQFGAKDERSLGNLELCVAAQGKVEHWWYGDQGGGKWHQSATFGHDVQAVVALVQGSFGFNLEVVVLRTDRKLQHFWRDSGGWHEGVVIGSA